MQDPDHSDVHHQCKLTAAKLCLLSYGVNADPDVLTEVGDAYKETNFGYNDPHWPEDIPEGVKLPEEIVLDGNVVVSYRHCPNSPFELNRDADGQIVLYLNDDKLCRAAFSPRPDYYEKETNSGTPMHRIGSSVGFNSVYFMLRNWCEFFSDGNECKFCSLRRTAEDHDSVELRKQPQDVVNVVNALPQTSPPVESINLIAGSLYDHNQEFDIYIDLVERITTETPYDELPGSLVCMPPDDFSKLEEAYDAGVRQVKFNMEVFHPDRFEELLPGKAKYGREKFLSALERSVEIFGAGNVSSNLILSLEPEESVKEGFRYMAEQGIVPVGKIFHPDEGTPLEDATPWRPSKLLSPYIELATLYHQYELTPFLNKHSLRGDISWELYHLLESHDQKIIVSALRNQIQSFDSHDG